MKSIVRIKRITAVLLVMMMTIALTACGKEPYSAGELDGTVYTNKWANIRIEVPDDFQQVDPSIGGAVNGKYKGFDVGCMFAKNDKTHLPMVYVMCREGEVDINEIGEDFTKEFGGSTGLLNVQQGNVTYQVTIDKGYYTIADESYMCFHIGVSVADVYCAFRAVDDTGAICICAITMNGSPTIEEVFKMVEKLK